MDHHLLLTAVPLHLDPAVRPGMKIGGVFAVKQPAGPAYLRLTSADWTVLAEFGRPSKVPEVLRRLLEQRSCPPLRDFYEVILKAHRAGILREGEVSAPAPHPVRWLRSGDVWPRRLGWVAGLAGFAFALVPGPAPSLAPLDLLAGWGVWCAALTLGQMMAAAAVSGGEGKIYRPHLNWRTWAPHLAFDLRDGQLLSRDRQLALVLAGWIVPALAVALVTSLQPAWSLPVVAGWFWRLRPVVGGEIIPLFEVLLGRLRPDTKRDYLFGPNRGLYARRRAAVRSLSPAVVALALVYGGGWCLAVLVYGVQASGLAGEAGGSLASVWRESGLIFALWLGAVVMVLAAIELGWWLWRCVRVLRPRIQLGLKRRSYSLPAPLDEAALVGRLLRSALFRRLPPDQQQEIARHLQVVHVPAGTVLHEFDEDPARVGLILSGEVRQWRRGPTGHVERMHGVAEDELFGVHRIGDFNRRQRAKARTPLWYLSLSMADFQALVVARVGAPAVEHSAVQISFLRRLELCATWHPQALARFVQLTTVLDCNEGDVIIRRGEDTLQLFIVQEGKVEVVLPRGRRRTLGPGSYFGEIGLLQNSQVVADVRARTRVRCLAIQKSDFLRFMTHNPSVGLQVERVSSERLGHPIFPLGRQSFDIR